MCPIATDTYRANFPSTHVITERLEKVNLNHLRRRIGAIDLLLASPECTNHTCAKGAAPRDEASRATALFAVEYARAFKPRWLVLENVVHMRPWSRYGELKSELAQLGYTLAEQILNASDFGVGQSRRRLFLVGDRTREPQLAKNGGSRRRKTAASVLDKPGTWPTRALRSERRAVETLMRADRAIGALGDNAPFLIVYYGSDGGGGWQPLNRPLRTVTTIDRFALVTPVSGRHEMRMLQVPELRRAMGFMEDYQLPRGTRRDRIKLLGNGVCPPVMQAVVHALCVDEVEK